MKPETYVSIEDYAREVETRELIPGPVAQFAGHTSGHSPYIEYSFSLGFRRHGPPRTALGFWIVLGRDYRPLTSNG